MWPKACSHVREGYWPKVISLLVLPRTGNIRQRSIGDANEGLVAPSNVIFHNLTPNLTSSRQRLPMAPWRHPSSHLGCRWRPGSWKESNNLAKMWGWATQIPRDQVNIGTRGRTQHILVDSCSLNDAVVGDWAHSSAKRYRGIKMIFQKRLVVHHPYQTILGDWLTWIYVLSKTPSCKNVSKAPNNMCLHATSSTIRLHNLPLRSYHEFL